MWLTRNTSRDDVGSVSRKLCCDVSNVSADTCGFGVCCFVVVGGVKVVVDSRVSNDVDEAACLLSCNCPSSDPTTTYVNVSCENGWVVSVSDVVVNR